MIKFDLSKDKWVVDEEWNISFKKTIQELKQTLNEALIEIKKLKMAKRYRIKEEYKKCIRESERDLIYFRYNKDSYYHKEGLHNSYGPYSDEMFELIEEKERIELECKIIPCRSPSTNYGALIKVGNRVFTNQEKELCETTLNYAEDLTPEDLASAIANYINRKHGDIKIPHVPKEERANLERPLSNAQKLTNEIKGDKPKTERVTLKDEGCDFIGKGIEKLPVNERTPIIENGTKKYTQREMINLFDIWREINRHHPAFTESFEEFIKDK